MKKTEFINLFYEIKTEIEEIGFKFHDFNFEKEVITFTNGRRCLGTCRKEVDDTGYLTCTFTFSKYILNFDKIEWIENIIYHELSHAIDYKNNNHHNATWKLIASKINKECGCHITMRAPEEVMESIKKTDKYIFQCKKCGAIVTRVRKSKFTENYKNYYCGKCHGSFRQIKPLIF